MSTEARKVEDARTPDPTMRPRGRIPEVIASLVSVFVVGLLGPVYIAAPKWFARQFARHPLAIPGVVAVWLAAAWTDAMFRTAGIHHNVLILGALGFMGLWAVGTVLSICLVCRWEDEEQAAAYRAGSLVFCFGAGFCLLLLLIYHFGMPAAKEYIQPHLPAGRPQAIFSLVMAGAWFAGVVLSVIAPIQIFRGLVSVGGGAVPALEPLCRDCGYNLRGVEQAYRAGAAGLDVRDVTEPVCSECGCPLAASMEPASRPGTVWTRGEDLSLWSWLRTVRQVATRPREFFERLPLASSRVAAVRFWMLNLLACLGTVAVLFAANHAICHWTGIAFPVPITGYQSAPLVNTPTDIWLPATLIGATLVMWAVVMTSLLAGCATAEYVWKRVCLLRERNMHPAGLLLASYLSGHVAAILAGATAAFLGVRLAVLAIPAKPGLLPYEWLMLIRNWAAYIGVAAGLLAAGACVLFWYWPADTRAGRALRYANG